MKYKIGDKVRFRVDTLKVLCNGEWVNYKNTQTFIIKGIQEFNDIHGSTYFRYCLIHPKQAKSINMICEENLISLSELRQEKIKNILLKD